MEVIYQQGTKEVIIPPAGKLAVYTEDKCQVYLKAGYPNVPPTSELIDTVENEQTVFGPYASGAVIQLNAGAANVYFVQGTAPVVPLLNNTHIQPTPSAKTVAVTLTAAELLTLIITGTQSSGATAAYTLPTGALMDAATELEIGQAFEWSLLNESAAAADTITVTSPGASHTIVGNPIVQSRHVSTGGITGSAGRFSTKRTAVETYITYRIA